MASRFLIHSFEAATRDGTVFITAGCPFLSPQPTPSPRRPLPPHGPPGTMAGGSGPPLRQRLIPSMQKRVWTAGVHFSPDPPQHAASHISSPKSLLDPTQNSGAGAGPLPQVNSGGLGTRECQRKSCCRGQLVAGKRKREGGTSALGRRSPTCDGILGDFVLRIRPAREGGFPIRPPGKLTAKVWFFWLACARGDGPYVEAGGRDWSAPRRCQSARSPRTGVSPRPEQPYCW